MKTVLVVVLITLSFTTSVKGYQDPPKDVKCVVACNGKYVPQWQACHAVAQCEAFVEYELGNCVHQCPDAKP
jgi:hypothetical protein